jgi:hypothetical protein
MESFQYTWLRIAFELHLGDPKTGERKRPPCFTILDSHGNRKFASYLGDHLSTANTEVRLVTREEVFQQRQGRQQSLGGIVDR